VNNNNGKEARWGLEDRPPRRLERNPGRDEVMNKVYVVWADYDGVQIVPADSREEAEPIVANILKDVELNVNGTHLISIIEGKQLGYRVEKRVTAIKLVG